MGTKDCPGKYDCYEAAENDEPMFVLLARDPLAPMLVEDWAKRRVASRGPSAKTREAFDCANAMRDWQADRKQRDAANAEMKRVAERTI